MYLAFKPVQTVAEWLAEDSLNFVAQFYIENKLVQNQSLEKDINNILHPNWTHAFSYEKWIR